MIVIHHYASDAPRRREAPRGRRSATSADLTSLWPRTR
jgi:hypothetical protein